MAMILIAGAAVATLGWLAVASGLSTLGPVLYVLTAAFLVGLVVRAAQGPPVL